MKKLATFLVILGLLAITLPVMAKEVTVGGVFQFFHYNDLASSAADSSWVKVRPQLDYKLDDFNSVTIQLQGDSFPGDNFRLAYLKTDITGALGLALPVTAKSTIGYFDTYFTNWSYVSMSGWEFYYDWPNKLVNQGQNKNGALQLDVGFGPVNVHWWNDFLGENIMVGADAAFGPVTAYLAYGSAMADLGAGNLSIEAKFATKLMGDMLSIAVPAFFRYGLGDQAFTYGGGVGVDYSMFHVAAGLEGDDVDALDNIVFDVSVAPMAMLKVWVSAYMNLAAVAPATAFTGADIGAKISLGAANFILGYALASEGVATISVYNDTYAAKGMYFGIDVGL